jgi:hypothetical protein
MSNPSKELVPTEAIWPPKNTTDLMNYFQTLENAKEDGLEVAPGTGMTERALRLVQALSTLGNVTRVTAINNGNTRILLQHSPSGSPKLTEESLALTSAAYAVTGAEMTDAHESLKRRTGHAIYEGSLTVNRSNQERIVPIAFKETYLTDANGKVRSMIWLARTNYPIREEIESRRLQEDKESRDFSEKDRLIYLGASIEELVKNQGMAAEPEYHYPEAA